MEYAVIQTGGKQYRVKVGDSIKVEKLELAAGEGVIFDQVPLYVKEDQVMVGSPFVKDGKVTGEIVSQVRDKKKEGIRYESGGYRRKFGHRQDLTQVVIKEINIGKKTKSKDKDNTD